MIIDEIDDGIVLVKEDLKISFANKFVEKIKSKKSKLEINVFM